jgi:hypothetical protein
VRNRFGLAVGTNDHLPHREAFAELQQPALSDQVGLGRSPQEIDVELGRDRERHPADADSNDTYIVKSVSAIMAGPEIVPPGRSILGENTCRTRAAPWLNCSIVTPLAAFMNSGKWLESNRVSSSRLSVGSGIASLAPRALARHLRSDTMQTIFA